MRKIIFDLETSNTFGDTGSSESTSLDLSVACIYDSEADKYTSYLQEDLSKLWPIIEKADMLVGFNSDHFDIPLLDKYYPGDLTKIKSLDILSEIRKSLGRRIKLDTIAEATLGEKKSGHGLDAIKWWRNGEKDKVIKYCLDDVRITKDVYDFAIANQKLKYRDGKVLKDIPLDTSNWEKEEESSMTHTLPF